MEHKLTNPVWTIEINKAVDPKSWRPNGVKIEKHKIVCITDKQIAVDSSFISIFTIRKKGERKESYNRYLDDVRVSIRTNDSILDNGVFIYLYSTKKPTKAILRKMVATANNEIDAKFGFLFEGVKNELWDLVDEYKIPK